MFVSSFFEIVNYLQISLFITTTIKLTFLVSIVDKCPFLLSTLLRSVLKVWKPPTG